ncbi:MAG: rRNA adenine N-6-methyltransferase family protein [Phycisphaerae bacterium]
MMPAASDPFQTQHQLQALLAAADLRPRKRFGQHFLIDRQLMGKLVASAELSAADTVVEVGCGTGSLTGALAARAGRVVAFEVDAAIAVVAAQTLTGLGNVELRVGDALDSKSRLSRAWRETTGERPFKLVANLPYDIATPLLLNLLTDGLAVERMCFTVQREVGDRLMAAAGTAAYGVASVLVGRVGRLRAASPGAATSVLAAAEGRERSAADAAAWARRAVVAGLGGLRRGRAAPFQQRRKTLAHVARQLSDGEAWLAAFRVVGVDPATRPERVAPDQWLAAWRQHSTVR